jgi:hypothetical protein
VREGMLTVVEGCVDLSVIASLFCKALLGACRADVTADSDVLISVSALADCAEMVAPKAKGISTDDAPAPLTLSLLKE